MCNTLDISYISAIEITQGHDRRVHLIFKFQTVDMIPQCSIDFAIT